MHCLVKWGKSTAERETVWTKLASSGKLRPLESVCSVCFQPSYCVIRELSLFEINTDIDLNLSCFHSSLSQDSPALLVQTDHHGGYVQWCGSTKHSGRRTPRCSTGSRGEYQCRYGPIIACKLNCSRYLIRVIDEIALYDRQIRLWGVQAQQKSVYVRALLQRQLPPGD